jgi:eukaryotic-like serine/threonine-protein kinase
MSNPSPLSGGEVVPDGLSSRGEQIPQLLEEQQRQWERGEHILAEVYRRQYPALADDPKGMLDLICNEILLRAELGNLPLLDEYLRRFPEYALPLRRRFLARYAPESRTPGDPGDGSEGTPTHPGSRENSEGITVPEVRPEPLPDGTQERGDWPKVSGYEILGQLGKGGMGVVYRAHHQALNRVIALKMLPGGDESDPHEVQRFTTEDRAMARLDHPHVVPSYEVGVHQGQPYFTMKVLGGGSLFDNMDQLRRNVRRAVGLVEKVARAKAHPFLLCRHNDPVC